jgi:hypothetical protein
MNRKHKVMGAILGGLALVERLGAETRIPDVASRCVGPAVAPLLSADDDVPIF